MEDAPPRGQSSDNTLQGWLSINGYTEYGAVAQVISEHCDTLDELQALTDADFEGMSALKLGTRRSLLAKVSQLRSSSAQAMTHGMESKAESTHPQKKI